VRIIVVADDHLSADDVHTEAVQLECDGKLVLPCDSFYGSSVRRRRVSAVTKQLLPVGLAG
jgi:hypothetical protein